MALLSVNLINIDDIYKQGCNINTFLRLFSVAKITKLFRLIKFKQ